MSPTDRDAVTLLRHGPALVALISIAGVITLTISLLARGRETAEDRLLREFRGAYPAEAPDPGRERRYEAPRGAVGGSAVRGFELAPGNRLDLDVTFAPEERGRTIVVRDRFTRRAFPLASIRVLDEIVATPRFPAPTNPRVPVWRERVSVAPRGEYALNARRGGEFGIQWTINDEAFPGHATPVDPAQTLPPNRWSRLRFVNQSFRLHPMHIHGQFFKVLARDGKPVDEPFFRDTVLLHRKESVDVGIVPLDWGKWMLHCHIQDYAEAGMMTLVEVGPPGRGRR